MSEPFIGQINVFPYNFAPRGWAFCNGQLLPIASNTALFSLIGTTFGGDGRTTMGLPELRGRVALHCGNGSPGPGLPTYLRGQRGGTPYNTMNITELPSHSHDGSAMTGQLRCKNATADTPTAVDNSLSNTARAGFVAQDPDSNMHGQSVTIEGTTGLTGGSQPVNNMQPFMGLNYCIALVGLFPSRS